MQTPIRCSYLHLLILVCSLNKHPVYRMVGMILVLKAIICQRRYFIVLYCIGYSISHCKGMNVKIITLVLMFNQTARASPYEMLISESFQNYTVFHWLIMGTMETQISIIFYIGLDPRKPSGLRTIFTLCKL